MYVRVDGSKQIHVVGYNEGGEDMLDRDTTLTPSGNLLNGLTFRGFNLPPCTLLKERTFI